MVVIKTGNVAELSFEAEYQTEQCVVLGIKISCNILFLLMYSEFLQTPLLLTTLYFIIHSFTCSIPAHLSTGKN